jgi:hypothetical protein
MEILASPSPDEFSVILCELPSMYRFGRQRNPNMKLIETGVTSKSQHLHVITSTFWVLPDKNGSISMFHSLL